TVSPCQYHLFLLLRNSAGGTRREKEAGDIPVTPVKGGQPLTVPLVSSFAHLRRRHEKRERSRGHPCNPGQGLAAFDSPACFFFCAPPQAAREERERSRAHPCNPGKGVAACDSPAYVFVCAPPQAP